MDWGVDLAGTLELLTSVFLVVEPSNIGKMEKKMETTIF